MLRWFLFVFVFIVLDIYAYQAFRSVLKNNWSQFLYVLLSLSVLVNLIYHFYGFNRREGFTHAHGYAVAFFIAIIVPKIVLIIMMFGEDVFRMFEALYRYLGFGNRTNSYFSSRRAFVAKLALGLASIPLASIIYGVYKGRYNYKVLRYSLCFEDLPEAFDGYKLTQISDIHSGSFDDIEKVRYAVDLINEQNSDVILFTGDIVNNKAEELEPFKTVFNKLKAKDGLFSVLGNHDYGDYVHWASASAKHKNLEDLKKLQKEIGFKLLLNDSVYLNKNGQRIALVGVENWGAGGFKKAGDLQRASRALHKDDFKILMSHDPSHWEKKVLKDPYHYHLTLSGHTHGMQFGIDIPGWIKWSPVKWRYKQWAGIYKELGQYINVNRGFGYLAFPGRIGMWPEITVIELKKGSDKV